jgi:hypothetical protein
LFNRVLDDTIEHEEVEDVWGFIRSASVEFLSNHVKHLDISVIVQTQNEDKNLVDSKDTREGKLLFINGVETKD